jgi:hypothetical protein
MHLKLIPVLAATAVSRVCRRSVCESRHAAGPGDRPDRVPRSTQLRRLRACLRARESGHAGWNAFIQHVRVGPNAPTGCDRGFGHIHRAIAGADADGADFYVVYLLPPGRVTHVIPASAPSECTS